MRSPDLLLERGLVPESALEWEPVLVLAWVPESAQVPALRRAWAPVWGWGRCLGFRLQGAARRQDPSRQWKAFGSLSGFFCCFHCPR